MRDTITGYFTANKEKARLYADDGKIYEAFLNIRNPFDWYKDIKKSQELLGPDWSYIDKYLAEDAIAEGYDGIFISKHYNSYLAISSPNQIKSATSNTSEFSTTNDDIRYRRVDSEDTNSIFNKTLENSSKEIEQYHRNKLQYGNLSQEQKDYIKLRNISIEDYNNMSDIEKEVLFHCMV